MHTHTHGKLLPKRMIISLICFKGFLISACAQQNKMFLLNNIGKIELYCTMMIIMSLFMCVCKINSFLSAYTARPLQFSSNERWKRTTDCDAPYNHFICEKITLCTLTDNLKTAQKPNYNSRGKREKIKKKFKSSSLEVFCFFFARRFDVCV